ncbi:MAG: diguanylate cyclase [Leptothrix sp. (in: b-proteobacteria)]
MRLPFLHLLLTAWLLLACQMGSAATHPAEVLVAAGVRALQANPEEGRRLAEEALTLLASTPDADLEVRARLLLCDYASERDPLRAREELKAMQKQVAALQRTGLRAGVITCEGELFEYAGDSAQAQARYQQAVSIAETAHDQEMLAQSLYLRGYLRGVHGEFADGLSDLRRAYSLFESVHLNDHALTTLNSLAILYSRMGDYAQARQFYERLLQEKEKSGLQRELAVTNYNLGRVHEQMADWSAAQQTFVKALALSREISYARGEAHALRGLAAVRNAMDDPRGALDLIQESESLMKRFGPDARLQGQILLQRGQALRLLHRHTDSLQALNTALDIFRRADSVTEIATTHEALSKLYGEMGNWHAAYEHLQRHEESTEHVLHQQLDQRFLAMKVEFNTSAKEQENAALRRERTATEKALQQEREANRLRVLTAVLSIGMALLLAVWAWLQRRARVRMEYLALTDELTGLANRRHVIDHLEQQMRTAEGSSCAAMIIDVDLFKSINDRHGHGVGDAVLREIANTMASHVRDPVLLGRMGGEEFLVVLPDTHPATALHVAERLREAVEQIDTSRWFTDRGISISIGVTLSRPGRDTASSLLHRADSALYEAKNTGRNRVVMRVLTPDDSIDSVVALPSIGRK